MFNGTLSRYVVSSAPRHERPGFELPTLVAPIAQVVVNPATIPSGPQRPCTPNLFNIVYSYYTLFQLQLAPVQTSAKG
jgi:hypothetical protein